MTRKRKMRWRYPFHQLALSIPMNQSKQNLAYDMASACQQRRLWDQCPYLNFFFVHVVYILHIFFCRLGDLFEDLGIGLCSCR